MKLINKDLINIADAKRAKISARFFKTGKGEYGEGDVFLGISNGELRRITKKHWKRVGLSDIEMLLHSEIHEKRLVALLILVEKFKDSPKIIYDFYLGNTQFINNWDLVDLSAWKILGSWLLDKKNRSVLDKLAISDSLWERRIAIVSTFAFIRKGELDDTLRITKILLRDSEDLIHKAVGWMLREVGKRNQDVLRNFLQENYDALPRMTLRYAIERFKEKERRKWLKKRKEIRYKKPLPQPISCNP